MNIKVRAYKSDDDKDGETIAIDIPHGGTTVCCAWDIDRLIAYLSQARDDALNAEVGGEVIETTFSF